MSFSCLAHRAPGAAAADCPRGVYSLVRVPAIAAGSLALAAALVAGGTARAQEASAVAAPLEPVIVSASRSAQPLQTAPIGATLITAQAIERAGVSDANEAVRKLGGVPARASLGLGREPILDLRGYGETAPNNLVVLVDGVRISENEQISARLSSIPAGMIERIEIVRGGASVLWGDGASGGVINVILKRPGAGDTGSVSGSATVAAESQAGRDAQVALNAGTAAAAFDVQARSLKTDGWRDNADLREDTVSVGVRAQQGPFSATLRAHVDDASGGLPGSLTYAQYDADPRQSLTPGDRGRSRLERYTAAVEWAQGGWRAQLDAAARSRSSSAYYAAYSYLADQQVDGWQLTPRVAYSSQAGAARHTTTVGADLTGWQFSSSDGERARQSGRAAFIQTDWTLPTRTRLSLGLREESIEQSSRGYAPWASDRRLQAREVALSQTLAPGWDAYVRWAQSFRLPNVDDNRYLPAPLKPQTNRDVELGAKRAAASWQAAVRLFRQHTDDEVACYVLGGLFCTNINLDPTRRQGVELDAAWQLVRGVDLSANWQWLDATFRSGANAGRELPLAAPRSGSVRVGWALNGQQRVELGAHYRAAMRIADDRDNSCGRRVPSATSLDLRYALNAGGWEWAVAASNLLDDDSYGSAFKCAVGGIYPDPGRIWRVSLTRRF
ncbi:MAG: TonB-dependent receptor [Pseudomonadota bacterium]